MWASTSTATAPITQTGSRFNGVKLNVATDWTLASPSGPVGTLARPIQDAQVTLIVAATGTLNIVGCERPRRGTQLVEGKGFTAHDFNQAYTDLKVITREMWDKFARVVRAPAGETMAILPPAATRANLPAAFDAFGNLIAALVAPQTATISTAMLPVVSAASTAAAQVAMGVTAIPVGSEIDWPGLVAPSGWFLEFGQAVGRSSNPGLLTVLAPTFSCVVTSGSNLITGISSTDGWPAAVPVEGPGFLVPGTTLTATGPTTATASLNASANAASITIFPFGNGDASTTFNVPDARGIVFAGKDNMGGTAANRLTSTYFADATAIGKLGGGQSHTLTTPEMPVHSHGITDPQHSHTTVGVGGGYTAGGVTGQQGAGATGLQSTGITIDNAGSGTAHSIVQPTSIRNKIIKGG